MSDSFNIIEIVDFQIQSSDTWNIFLLPLGAVLFIVTMITKSSAYRLTCLSRSRTRRGMVDRVWRHPMGPDVCSRDDACLCSMHPLCTLLPRWLGTPLQDTLIGLPFVGGYCNPYENDSGHRHFTHQSISDVRTLRLGTRLSPQNQNRSDTGFGWRYLLPLSILNLALAMIMRVAFWDGAWPFWLAPVMTLGSLAIFVVLAIDEDKEALENSNRIYHTQTLEKHILVGGVSYGAL